MPAPTANLPIVGDSVSAEARDTILNAALEVNHDNIEAHKAATDNPHGVTKEQVGLGDVDNVPATELRDRTTHTGEQPVSTVTGLQGALDGIDIRLDEAGVYEIDKSSDFIGLVVDAAGRVGATIDPDARYEPAADTMGASSYSVVFMDDAGGVGTAISPDTGVESAADLLTGASSYSVVFMDDAGAVGGAIDEDGTYLPSSGGVGPSEHTVDWWHFGVIRDPSKNLYATWCSNSPDAVRAEWSIGGVEWLPVRAFRSVELRPGFGKWLHTAEIEFRNAAPHAIVQVRSIGAEKIGKTKVCPTASAKIAFVSDWQLSGYSTTGRFAQFGDIVTAKECDFAIFNGDLWGSSIQGYFYTEAYAQTVFNFMERLADRYLTTDDAQLPWLLLAGNHEAYQVSSGGTRSSGYNGTGVYIGIDVVATSGFDHRQPNLHVPGATDIHIKNLLHIATVDTNHGQHLAAQRDWLESNLSQNAPYVAHAFMAGHFSPFNILGIGAQYVLDTAVYLRNVLAPIVQDYPTMRGWFSGHSHGFLATKPLTMQPDAALTDEQNGLRFRTDMGGVEYFVMPAIGSPLVQNIPRLDAVSSLDGEPMWQAFLGRDDDEDSTSYQIRGDILIGPTGLETEDLLGFGVLTVTPDDWTVEVWNQNNNLIWEN